jgi:hypothetical protein
MSGAEMTDREVLDLVVQRLNAANCQDLWHILSALRGPDGGTEDLKLLSTARLRHEIGFTRYEMLCIREANLLDSEITQRDVLLRRGSFHFRDHFVKASEAFSRLFDRELEMRRFTE